MFNGVAKNLNLVKFLVKFAFNVTTALADGGMCCMLLAITYIRAFPNRSVERKMLNEILKAFDWGLRHHLLDVIVQPCVRK